jgi:hypothetical protein
MQPKPADENTTSESAAQEPGEEAYCTYFDKNYLSRGLALYHSLQRHSPKFRLFVLCLDDETHQILTRQAYPHVTVVARAELEKHDPELLATRPQRSRVEYYFTTTPCWLRFIFDRFPEVQRLTYVDADLYFFASPAPLFEEMADASIAIVEHRFLPRWREHEANGRFNVGWLSFRRDEQGLGCVDWWRERCIEWCFDRVEGERYADQKYLDQWPRLFPRLRVMQHKGVNVAPWNLGNWPVLNTPGGITVGDQPLICFHFHQLKQVLGPVYSTGLAAWKVPLDGNLRRILFRPYVRELLHQEASLRRARIRLGHTRSVRGLEQSRRRALLQACMRPYRIAKLLLSGTCVAVIASEPRAQAGGS